MKFHYNTVEECDRAIHEKMLESILIVCTRSTEIEVNSSNDQITLIYFKDIDGNYKTVKLKDECQTSTNKEYLRKLAKTFLHVVDEL